MGAHGVQREDALWLVECTDYIGSEGLGRVGGRALLREVHKVHLYDDLLQNVNELRVCMLSGIDALTELGLVDGKAWLVDALLYAVGTGQALLWFEHTV